MAPNGQLPVVPYSSSNLFVAQKPQRATMEGLQRAMSDLSFELRKDELIDVNLPAISEVEDAKCECCGMSEECTLEYISRVREKFCGKWICGLCSEAVKEEMEKNGGRREEALVAHTSVCMRFNNIGRMHPVLYQAEAIKEILKKCSRMEGRRGMFKSNSSTDRGNVKKGVIMRSSSCIPVIITKEIH